MGRERRIKESRRNANVTKDKYLEFINITIDLNQNQNYLLILKNKCETLKAKQVSSGK